MLLFVQAFYPSTLGIVIKNVHFLLLSIFGMVLHLPVLGQQLKFYPLQTHNTTSATRVELLASIGTRYFMVEKKDDYAANILIFDELTNANTQKEIPSLPKEEATNIYIIAQDDHLTLIIRYANAQTPFICSVSFDKEGNVVEQFRIIDTLLSSEKTPVVAFAYFENEKAALLTSWKMNTNGTALAYIRRIKANGDLISKNELQSPCFEVEPPIELFLHNGETFAVRRSLFKSDTTNQDIILYKINKEGFQSNTTIKISDSLFSKLFFCVNPLSNQLFLVGLYGQAGSPIPIGIATLEIGKGSVDNIVNKIPFSKEDLYKLKTGKREGKKLLPDEIHLKNVFYSPTGELLAFIEDDHVNRENPDVAAKYFPSLVNGALNGGGQGLTSSQQFDNFRRAEYDLANSTVVSGVKPASQQFRLDESATSTGQVAFPTQSSKEPDREELRKDKFEGAVSTFGQSTFSIKGNKLMLINGSIAKLPYSKDPATVVQSFSEKAFVTVRFDTDTSFLAIHSTNTKGQNSHRLIPIPEDFEMFYDGALQLLPGKMVALCRHRLTNQLALVTAKF